jgi:hypothetical protein
VRERAFNAQPWEVRAILAGTKTQIRRPVKLPSFDRVTRIIPSDGAVDLWDAKDERGATPAARMVWHSITCPYGEPGDRLWVRETWNAIHVSVDIETGYGDDLWASEQIPTSDDGGYWAPVYAATDEMADMHKDDRGFVWRPAIHMPRWASRLTLEVTDVRVQRLQEISEEDAQAECVPTGDGEGSYREGFASIWQDINGKRAPWASNPWVWAVSFSVVARG